jgi:hypothetical protein
VSFSGVSYSSLLSSTEKARATPSSSSPIASLPFPSSTIEIQDSLSFYVCIAHKAARISPSLSIPTPAILVIPCTAPVGAPPLPQPSPSQSPSPSPSSC